MLTLFYVYLASVVTSLVGTITMVRIGAPYEPFTVKDLLVLIVFALIPVINIIPFTIMLSEAVFTYLGKKFDRVLSKRLF